MNDHQQRADLTIYGGGDGAMVPGVDSNNAENEADSIWSHILRLQIAQQNNRIQELRSSIKSSEDHIRRLLLAAEERKATAPQWVQRLDALYSEAIDKEQQINSLKNHISRVLITQFSYTRDRAVSTSGWGSFVAS